VQLERFLTEANGTDTSQANKAVRKDWLATSNPNSGRLQEIKKGNPMVDGCQVEDQRPRCDQPWQHFTNEPVAGGASCSIVIRLLAVELMLIGLARLVCGRRFQPGC